MARVFQIFGETSSADPVTPRQEMMYEFGCDGHEHAELTTRLDLDSDGKVEHAEVIRSRIIGPCIGGCTPNGRGSFTC